MNKILPCVVGLGYVGLPVFLALKKKFKTIGFDNNQLRIKNLKKNIDTNKEFLNKELKLENGSIYANDSKYLKECNFYIISVPTPIKENKLPELKYIKSAIEMISKYLKKDDIIFLESTVFPGTTDEFCKKILQKKNINFFIGYSSERINPGDKIHNIKNISKVVSINTKNKKVLSCVKKVYNCISNKIILSKKIKEAELSKLIENTQRDLNIALMNEIMILCHKKKLDFHEVIRLAKTKWNFLDFKPGLVGGHCLPVDPYYLSYYADKSKFKTNVTLAGRKINNYMEHFVFKNVYNELKKIKEINLKNIVICGLTYKPNVSDLRNSLAIEIYKKIKQKFLNIKGYDPIIDKKNSNFLKIENEFNNIKESDIFIFLIMHNKLKKLYTYAKKNNKIIIKPF
jgi:UDP-N-acetyl-D-glucosamine/UDP-N-acetyl-D-galactosamine dehydrogenase